MANRGASEVRLNINWVEWIDATSLSARRVNYDSMRLNIKLNFTYLS